MEPKWLTESRKYIEQKEITGPQSNDWIISLWQPIPWIWSTVTRRDDSLLPWCGAFIRFILVLCNIKPPKEWYRARGYINFGHRLHSPVLGAIGVIKNKRGYHVGIVAGRDNAGNVCMIGGNQDNQVKISAFKPDAFVAYVWPNFEYTTIPMAGTLPILSAALSASEA